MTEQYIKGYLSFYEDDNYNEVLVITEECNTKSLTHRLQEILPHRAKISLSFITTPYKVFDWDSTQMQYEGQVELATGLEYITIRYSEYTSDEYWQDNNKFIVGGHDILEILQGEVGKYIIIKIRIN